MFDTENLNRLGWYAAAEKRGYKMTDDIIFAHIGADLNTTRRLMTEHFIKYNKDFDFDALRADRIAWARNYIEKNGMPLKKGLNELLTWLYDKNFKTAIATSSGREFVDFYLAHADIKNNFDAIITWRDGMRGKPAPDIFLEAAKALDEKTAGNPPCRPENCLVLEDSYNGIKAARAANMTAVMIPDLLPPTPEIINLAYCVLDDLSQVINILA